MQPADLGGAQRGAGGIGGIGDEHQPGALVDFGQHGVHRDAVAVLGGVADLGLAGAGADGVGGEAVLAHDDVVAGLQERLVQQGEDLVGAAAEHQPVRLQPEALGHRGAQPVRTPVRIEVHPVGGADEGLMGLGAGAQDVFVRRQLDRVLEALGLGLAGLVGRDAQDAGLGLGAGRARGRTLWSGGDLGHGAVLTRRTASAQPRSRR